MRYCGMDTTGNNSFIDQLTTRQRWATAISLFVAAFAVLFLVAALMQDDGTRNTTEDRYWAETSCKGSVRQQLKAPSTAEFGITTTRELSDGAWYISGTVDAQNSFGAQVRSYWTCNAELVVDDWRATASVS